MSAQEVLLSAGEQGVHVYLKDNQLALRVKKNSLSSELKERIQNHKAEIIRYLESITDKKQQLVPPPVLSVRRDRPLPLSSAQQRLWFIDQLGEGSAHYNVSGRFLLQGSFHEDAFKRALKSLLERHEVLRTRFTTVEGEARQVIVDSFALPFARDDLSNLTDEEKRAEAQRLMREEARRPFDLESDLMLRVRLVELSDELHLVMYTMHHIASDAWSAVILQRELGVLYAAYCKNQPNPLPPLKIQYADYAVWQREWLQGQVLDEALAYWKQQLADLPVVHSLPLDKPRPARQRYVGKSHELLIRPELATKIAGLNRTHNTTLFMFMHTALAVLLSRCSGEQDIVVGSAITGRTHRDVEGLIGFFINDLVLRLRLEGAAGFAELLKQHREIILDAYAHQHVPFETLVEELNPQRSMSYSPLFQIKLDVQNNEEASLSLVDLELLNARAEALRPQGPQEEERNVRHDLYISVAEQQNGLSVSWRYNTDLFFPETIARLSSYFETLLEGIVAFPEQPVQRLPLLTKAQEESLLIAGRGPVAVYPQGKCIHQLFEEQVQRTPHETAVIARNGALTFHELNVEANRLAHYLLAHGAGPGSRVALCLERSLDMVVGILGALKAGAAYLPLDPANPQARLEYMLRDSGCQWVLTQRELMSSLSWAESQVLPIDGELRSVLLKDYGEDNPVLEGRGLTSTHLAYVIYTSGSTGQPKGVMVEHDGLVRYCDHARQRYYTPDLAGSLVATSYGFDLTIPALYLPLLAGGHIRLLDEGRELEDLAETLASAERPYLLRLTPSHLTGLLALMGGRQSSCPHAFVIGGEPLPVPVVRALRAVLPRATIYNHYGPTESIVGCSFFPLEKAVTAAPGGYCAIGKALGHKQLLVLNHELQLEPAGTPGQLYVGGDGLAQGYLAQPALTARKFLSNPFSPGAGARLYETGDLVRWLPDGNLEFLGRLDQQVKIRGLRIELGEIERSLLSLPGVRECAVTMSGGSEDEKRLVAYVVPHEDPASGAEEEAALVQRKQSLIQGYREALGKRLPEYMVPLIYVFLPRLPLTVNGKVDRKALPAPEEGDLLKSRYVAPRNATEEKMCALWQEVLKLGQVGIEDDFFLLGGHSLLATRLINRIRDEFEVELPLRAIFESPTIASLTPRLTVARDEFALPPVTPVPRGQPLPLSFAQQRLWFIDRLGEGSAQYNMPSGHLLLGELNVAAFKRALKSLLERHEVLRTHFVEEDREPRQLIVEEFELPFTLHDLSDLGDEEKAAEAQRLMREEAWRPFALASDLMLRVRIVKLSSTQHLILYTTHHIASDGWSKGIFQRELSALYQAYCKDQPNPLQPLRVQYADYALWQRGWLRGEVLERELEYWEEQLAGIAPVHGLPLDHARPARQSFEGRVYRQVLSKETTARIKTLCERHAVTLFMFLETAFAVLVARYSNEKDVVVGTPIAGRMHKDVEGLIGFFVNSLVLRLDVSNGSSFGDLLRKNSRIILDAYDHQHLPFEMLVEKIRPERNLNYNPLVQIMFAVQNNEYGQFDLSTEEVEPIEVAQERGYLLGEDKRTRFDLEVHVREHAGALSISWLHNISLFDSESIVRLATNYEVLLHSAIESLTVDGRGQPSVERLELLSETEKGILSHEWNRTAASFPREKCIHELFEQRAREKPDAVALVCAGQQLTYAELNRRSNMLARFLELRGVGAEVRVGLCLERSMEMIVGLLGTLKAGGCYVPLDPQYPLERLRYLINDSGVGLILSQHAVMGTLEQAPSGTEAVDAVACVALDGDWCDGGDGGADVSNTTSPQNLAYVIYTSGSTGEPKGVGVVHRSLHNLAAFQSRRYCLDGNSRVLQFASFSFDAACWDWSMALTSGSVLHLPTEEMVRSAELLGTFVKQWHITYSYLPPALLSALNAEDFDSVATLTIGGESTTLEALEGWRQSRRLINAYGPTEGTVVATTSEVPATGGSLSIGRPIENVRAYVLDEEAGLVPTGVAGELCIGGEQLARGYLNRAGLTAERFLPNAFAEEPGERLYRTGDLVRYRPDGQLEFIGRADAQVKLRGFRIELGEIEAALGGCAQLASAVVSMDRRDGVEPRLIAHVCPTAEFLDGVAEKFNREDIAQWSSLFDATYEEGEGSQPADLDFSGWESSYTGAPIPLEQMREWLEGTAEVLDELRPKRLLEIGCGTGLLLFRYGAYCEAVDALDISAVALGGVRRELERRGWAHVRLGQGDALGTGVFGEARYDTVVLNSVVQYFPNRQYLEKVIVEALGRLEDGGRVLLGDVRNMDLFEAHAAAVERSRLSESTPVSVLASRVQRHMQQEPELLVSPSYFARLPERYPEIGRVDVLVKRGLGDNEMQQYRYEVVLTKGRAKPVEELRWKRFESFERLGEWLTAGREESFGVSGVPNGRVEEHLSLWEGLTQWSARRLVHPPEEVGRWSAAALQRVQTLQSLLALAQTKGYRVAVTWSQDRLDQVDVLFSRGELPAAQARNGYGGRPSTNCPQLGLAGQRLSEELPKSLEERLPEYMVPRVYIALERLPLTVNGKVDRKALPAPEEGDLLKSRYVAPRNATEEKMCALWQEVLKLGQVGIEDDFFLLGGHSLLATRLINRIRDEFEVELPLRAIFESPTIASLTPRLTVARDEFALPPVTPVPRGQPLPLSFAQQRLWFIDRLGEGSAQYNMPSGHLLLGELNVAAFKRALKSLLERHEVLRTHFVEEDREPRQLIVEEFELPFTLHDLSDLGDEEKAAEAQRLMREEAWRPFALASDLMLRVRIVKLSSTQHLILYTTHHIASDGWSKGIFQRELSALYQAYCKDQPNPLQPLRVQYADYALWQRGWLRGEVLERELEYWEEQLAGIAPVHGLPLDHARPARQSFEGRVYRQVLSKETTARIKTLCERHAVTLFMFLETAFAVLVARYSNEKDVVVGTPIAGRMHKDVEGLIGFFVNSLVLRLDVSNGSSFGDLLRKNSRIILDAYDHQHLPFEMLVEKIRPERNLNYNPLVQIMFAVQNNEYGQFDLSTEEVEPIEVAQERGYLLGEDKRTRFDLEVHVREHAGALSISWLHNISLFDSESIVRLATNYEVLLHSAIESLTVDGRGQPSVERLELLSETEKGILSHEWNRTAASFPREKCIHELFEQRAERQPEAIALVHGGNQLSYEQLNRRANQVAHCLRAHGVGPEVRVGVCMERSPQIAVGLLGILKAGGAYVPLDPEYPAARLEYMLAQSGCRVVLSEQRLMTDLPLLITTKVLPLDAGLHEALFGAYSDANVEVEDSGVGPTNLAYVIYTSGSTGRPKGSAIIHQNISRLIYNDFVDYGSERTILCAASPSFDAFTFELWGALLHGGRCVMADSARASLGELGRVIGQHGVDCAFLTTALFNQLIVDSADSLKNLKYLMVGGEAASIERFREGLRQLPKTVLSNIYGPTENTTFSSLCPLGEEKLSGRSTVPIGRPIRNTQAYVLGAEGEIVPVGVVGELYLGGAGLARGYLGRASLTAEKFVPSAVSQAPGERLYRTGDLVRYRPDGQLEFIGRADAQVKLRGFRIELGEIETALRDCALLSSAVVSMDRRDGVEPRLIAHVCPTAEFLDGVAEKFNREDIAQWSSLFDATYEEGEGSQPADLDFSGWESSYTGAPIPLEQMREWLEGTAEVLDELRPKRLLEIGCGTGLLLFRYGAYCEAVDALDISAVALGGVRRELERRGWAHVRLGQGDALGTGVFGEARYDTVVLNSVVQYFPNRQYLEKVIVEALGRLEDGGRVLLGDVRNMDLFEAHAAAVERSRLSESTPVSVLASRVQRHMQQEPELLVSPSYFARLPERYPEIGRVDVLVKRGLGDNEMQQYRYEVVLTKGRAKPVEELRWKRFESFERLGEWLTAGREESFGVSGVPNGRVEEHLSLWEGLTQWSARRLVHPPEEVGRWSAAALQRVQTLQSLLALAQTKGYRVAVTWSQDRLDQVDVLFSRGELPAAQARNGYGGRPSTNCPQLGLAGQRLSEELPKSLEERLPEYMVPRVYIALERLPLTVNGKVDRKALPVPEEADLQKAAYAAPRNEIERRLCELWQGLLNVERVGIHDDFFHLGGHSLLVVKLRNKIAEAMEKSVTVKELYTRTTIASLAEWLQEAALTNQDSLPVVFMFPGRGLRRGVGQRLYEKESAYRVAFDECAELVKRLIDVDIREINSRLPVDRIDFTSSADLVANEALLFSLEYSLARYCQSLSLEPQTMIGIGAGEYVAACISGVFALEDALALLVTRGQTVAEIRKQSPNDSARINEVLRPFYERLAETKLSVPRKPYLSSITAKATSEEVADKGYWLKQLTAPPLFSSCVEELLRGRSPTLLELGPADELARKAKTHGASAGACIVSLLGNSKTPEAEGQAASDAVVMIKSRKLPRQSLEGRSSSAA